MADAATPAPAPTPAAPAPKLAAVPPAAETPEVAAEAKEASPTIYKLKAGDEEEEYDIGNAEHVQKLLRLAQLGKGSDKRFKEAKALEAKAQKTLDGLTKRDLAALQEAGIDPYDWAEKMVLDRLQLESMTPEQRAMAKREKDVAEREAKLKADEDKRSGEQLDAAARREVASYNDSFIRALETVPGVPPTPRTIARMAELASVNVANGIEMPADQLARMVRDDLDTEYLARFDAMDGPALIKALPKSVLDKIAKAQIEQAKTMKLQPLQQNTQKPTMRDPNADGERKPVTEAQYDAYMAKVKAGKL